MRKLLFILFLICPFFLNAQVLNEDDLGFYREDQLYFGFSFISLDANNKYFKQNGLSSHFQLGFVRDIPLISSGKFAIGLGVGYPRLKLAGNNGFVYFANSDDPPVTSASVGLVGSTFYIKTPNPADTERLRISNAGSWGIEGANYGTSGQVLTSGGSGAAISWEDAALSTTAHSTPPANASDTGTAGQMAYDDDYLYVCISTDTWKRTALSTW